MASAQAMEEELQQSVLLSEEDGESEPAPTTDNGTTIHAASYSTKRNGGSAEGSAGGGKTDDADGEDLSERDASGEDVDEDASGEEDNDMMHQQLPDPSNEDEEEDDDQDEDQSVGAVKIKPGDSDDELDAGSDLSDNGSAAEADEEEEEESEEEAAWDEADGGDDDEESAANPSNRCIFCKEDEENDPSEDFEPYLSCTRCGNNAHQQCARDDAALAEDNNPSNWRCPDCYSDESDVENDHYEGDASVNEDPLRASESLDPAEGSADLSDAPSEEDEDDDEDMRSTDDRTIKEESVNGTRLLRKRRESPVESDDGVRKRRRQGSNDFSSAAEDAIDVGQSSEPSRSHSARALRLKVTRPPPVLVEKRSRTALVLRIQVRPGNLKEILSRRKRDRKRAPASAPRPGPGRPPVPRVDSTPIPVPMLALPTPFTSDSYSQPFYSFFDKDTDEVKGKPYGGILTEAEADTSKTLPSPDDRRRFDQAKQQAEDEWRARVLAMQAEAEVPMRRPKRTADNASQIECIEFGGWEIDTWYAAPYPAEYSRNRVLYICEFCLKYMNSDYVAWRHKLKCGTKHPPGDEIYRHGSVSVFEVDGRKHPVYCQNLCLLAKLFLGSKTLYYDVEPFLFYVLCEYDDCGYHFVGYFSKEKRASSQNNVSCILTLPIHQRKGYGNLLIDFSYLLTKVEEKTGSPEKPLSDMGLVSYRNYWRLILCRYFLNNMQEDGDKPASLSIRQISDDTGMTPDDVIAALEGLRALVRDPQTKLYAFRVDVDFCQQYVAKWESKRYVKLKPEALAWTPYVMGRSNAVNFELGPPINTIAPREDETAQLQEGSNIDEELKPEVNGDGDTATSKRDSEESQHLTETENERNSNLSESAEKAVEEDEEDAAPEEEDIDPDDPDSWALPYRNVPRSRFEVFPAIAGRRADRVRNSVSRPSVSRAASGGSRPKRSGGSRRSTTSRPRSSTSRRKSGGTGRGPGRWPKGTKKADYGNAASGPGLPPGWRDKQPNGQDLAPDELGDSAVVVDEDDPAQDEVQVYVGAAKTNGTSSVTNGTGTKESTNPSGSGDEDEDEDEDAEGELEEDYMDCEGEDV